MLSNSHGLASLNQGRIAADNLEGAQVLSLGESGGQDVNELSRPSTCRYGGTKPVSGFE